MPSTNIVYKGDSLCLLKQSSAADILPLALLSPNTLMVSAILREAHEETAAAWTPALACVQVPAGNIISSLD